MIAANWPRDDPESERLLLVDPGASAFRDAHVRDLAGALRAGDLLVVNDASTVPASLRGRTRDGDEIEVRLAARAGDGSFRVIAFGAGDWRTPTEQRPLPPALRVGDTIQFDRDLVGTVIAVESPRRVRVRFEADETTLWPVIYRLGAPIQYAYMRAPLALYHVQTRYASRPWAFELPSAGRPLTGAMLMDLQRRGVQVRALTHAAGISSTGDADLDATLPWPERYEIPESTASAVRATRHRGGRVVAVGTSVVRALEATAATHDGVVVSGEGEATLRIGPSHRLTVVDGLLTGVHMPPSSHHELIQAFVPPSLLSRVDRHLMDAAYLGHEFGDNVLVLSGSASAG